MTLGESVERAMQSSPIIRILKTDIDTSQARLQQVRGAWHPQIRLKMEKGTSRTRETAWTNLSRSRVQLTQMLYDFQKTAYQSESGEHTLDEKRQQLLEGKQRLALLVAKAYLELLKLDRVLSLIDQNIAAYEAFLVIMEKREDAGVASFSDVQRITGLLQQIRKERLSYLADKYFALEAFTLIVGQAPDTLVMPELERLTISASEEEILQQAKAVYFGVRAREYQLRSARATLNESRRALYPQINLEASMANDQSLDTRGEHSMEQQVRFVVSYHLWDGFIARNKVNEKKSLFMRSQFQLDDYLRTLEREVREAFSAMARLKEEQVANAQSLSVNRDVVELYRKEFALGQKSLLEITVAQSDYHQAQTEDVTLYFDYYISVLGVLFYMNAVTQQIQQL